MTHSFDKAYWEQHWNERMSLDSAHDRGPTPYLVDAAQGLRPGTALDAGCGSGSDALWLAARGWQVTGADLSAQALAVAARRAALAAVSERIRWAEVDLSTWEPVERWALVTSSYVHPAIPQLQFYRRIAGWVAPGGTLLIVGHGRHPSHDPHHSASAPPEEATVTLAAVTGVLDPAVWQVEAGEGRTRPSGAGEHPPLSDVVVRATRRR